MKTQVLEGTAREITEAIGKYKRYGITMCYYCATPMNWGLNAPQLYLDYRLRMNYDADPQKVLADFYAGLYGPAAGAMKTFFDFVDESQNTPIQGAKKGFAANRYLSQWPVTRADAALKLLDQAEAAVGDDRVIKGRIELSRVSTRYIRENSRCFDLERRYKQSGEMKDMEALSQAITERETWIDGILKKQTEGYYTAELGLIDPFPKNYRKEGTLRDQVVYGKNMAGHGLQGGPFDIKPLMDFYRKYPTVESSGLKAEAAPKIDGVLDDAVWAKAPKNRRRIKHNNSQQLRGFLWRRKILTGKNILRICSEPMINIIVEIMTYAATISTNTSLSRAL